MDDYEAAYIAGLMEGDGHIRMSVPKDLNRVHGWQMSVQIGQKDPELLHKVLGIAEVGHIQKMVRRPGTHRLHPKGYIFYRWQVQSADQIIWFLPRIIPYLRLKRNIKRAELVLRLARTKLPYSSGKRWRLSEETRDERKYIMEQWLEMVQG